MEAQRRVDAVDRGLEANAFMRTTTTPYEMHRVNARANSSLESTRNTRVKRKTQRNKEEAEDEERHRGTTKDGRTEESRGRELTASECNASSELAPTRRVDRTEPRRWHSVQFSFVCRRERADCGSLLTSAAQRRRRPTAVRISSRRERSGDVSGCRIMLAAAKFLAMPHARPMVAE